MNRLRLFTIAGLAIALSVLTSCGFFPEASFTLDKDSRLPRWFSPPSDLVRGQLTVSLDYYVGSSGRTATVKLLGPSEKVLQQVKGKLRGAEPNRLKIQHLEFPPGYPMYEVITINGITEIFEHRRMEPYFYITDDQSVWKELGVEDEHLKLAPKVTQ